MTIEQLSSVLKHQIIHHDLASASGFAIALSGGADSLALAHAAVRTSLKVVTLTVDHGIRTGSDKEAHEVAGWMKDAGISHHILQAEKKSTIFDGETDFVSINASKSSGNIQANARFLRYKLMENWCVDHNFSVLITAHQKDDVAENFLLRLMRGSGVDGLAAMPATAPGLYYPDRVTRFRPFLGLKKNDLMAALKKEKMPFINDPSNINTRFNRTHVRSFLANPPLEGLTVDRLAETSTLLLGARLALKSQTGEWARHCLVESRFGGFFLKTNMLEKAPKDIGLRLISWLIQSLSGRDYKPRLKSLEALYYAILNPDFSGKTLSGIVFTKRKGIMILATREPVAMPKNVAVVDGRLYDHRWRITLTDPRRAKNLTLGPLEEKGWICFKEKKEAISDIPFKEGIALPAFFRAGCFVSLAIRGGTKEYQEELEKTGAFVVLEQKQSQDLFFEQPD